MMSNANQGGWANRVKSDLSATPTSQLKRVGGGGNLEPIATYFQFTAPKQGAPNTAQQLKEGMSILGIYEGSFTTKKFGTTYHKVKTDKGLVAIPGSGQLNSLMKNVVRGAEVQVVYEGKETIQKGNFAGKQAHKFIVSASETVAA
jgi:hypothetical protein